MLKFLTFSSRLSIDFCSNLQLQQITANIRNSAPACADPSVSRNTNLFIMIALVERLGPLSLGGGGGDNAVNIEKFTNQLRSKYQNYQVQFEKFTGEKSVENSLCHCV